MALLKPGLLVIISLFLVGSVVQAKAIQACCNGAFCFPAETVETNAAPFALNEINVQHTHALLRWTYCGSDSVLKVLIRPVGAECWEQRHYCAGNVTHLQVFALEPSTEYEWTVKPAFACASSAPMELRRFTTLANPCDVPAPLGSESADPYAETLSWTGVAEAHRYKLRVRKCGTENWQTIVVPAAETSFTVRGLLPSTSYEWKIRTLCQPGNVAGTPWSSTAVFCTAAECFEGPETECCCPMNRMQPVMP